MWCGNLPLGHRFPLTSAHIGNSEQHISIGHIGDIFWDSVLKEVVSVFFSSKEGSECFTLLLSLRKMKGQYQLYVIYLILDIIVAEFNPNIMYVMM